MRKNDLKYLTFISGGIGVLMILGATGGCAYSDMTILSCVVCYVKASVLIEASVILYRILDFITKK